MKRLFFCTIILFATTSFGQFSDTAALNTFIRDSIKDRRPDKITALQVQKALLGAIKFIKPLVDVQVYNTPGTYTWVKPAGAKWVEIYVVGAAGGAGSGRKGATTSGRGGGGTPGGGARVNLSFHPNMLGATETVTVGAGGTGGAAVTTNDTNGNNGTAGGATSFGSWLLVPGSLGGGGGLSGQTGGGQGGIQAIPQATTFTGGSGAGGGISSVAAGSSYPTPFGSTGGGAGGNIHTNNTIKAAGSAGNVGASVLGTIYAGYNGTLAGGVAGVSGATEKGGDGVSLGSYSIFPGTGGGGGAASITGNAGDGGNGGFPGGGGGGGGAATNDVGNSGKGGNGGGALLMVVTYF